MSGGFNINWTRPFTINQVDGFVPDPDFTPLQIPGLVLWQDASSTALILDVNGAPVTDGTKVKTWVDKTGRAHNAVQTNAPNQPTYRATAAPSGLPSIEFFASGALELLVAPDHADFNTVAAMYCAISWKTGGTTQTFFAKYQPTGNQRQIQMQFNTNPNYVVVTSPDGTGVGLTTLNTTDVVAAGNRYVCGVRWNGTTLTAKINNNTGTQGTATPASIFDGTGGVCTGALENGSQAYKGYSHENLLYNIVPDATQDVQIINYLKAKWSIP